MTSTAANNNSISITRSTVGVTNHMMLENSNNLEKFCSSSKKLIDLVSKVFNNCSKSFVNLGKALGSLGKSIKIFSVISTLSYFTSGKAAKDHDKLEYLKIMKMTLILANGTFTAINWVESKLELVQFGSVFGGILKNSLSLFGTGILFTSIACNLNDIKNSKESKVKATTAKEIKAHKKKENCNILESIKLTTSVAGIILGSIFSGYVAATLAFVSASIGIVKLIYKEQDSWVINKAAA